MHRASCTFSAPAPWFDIRVSEGTTPPFGPVGLFSIVRVVPAVVQCLGCVYLSLISELSVVLRRQVVLLELAPHLAGLKWSHLENEEHKQDFLIDL